MPPKKVVKSESPVGVSSMTSLKRNVTAVAFALVAVVFLSGFLFMLNKNLTWLTKKDSVVAEKKVDMAQLEREYESRFRSTIAGYLAGYDNSTKVLDDSFVNSTQNVENEILALVVPAKYKDVHLSAAITLGQIVQATQQHNGALVSTKIDTLHQLLNQL